MTPNGSYITTYVYKQMLKMPRAKNKSRKIGATPSGLIKEAIEKLLKIKHQSAMYLKNMPCHLQHCGAMYISINLSSILPTLFLNQNTIAGKYFRMLKKLC